MLFIEFHCKQKNRVYGIICMVKNKTFLKQDQNALGKTKTIENQWLINIYGDP